MAKYIPKALHTFYIETWFNGFVAMPHDYRLMRADDNAADIDFTMTAKPS